VKSSNPRQGLPNIAIVATLLLLAGINSTALGASDPAVNCDRDVRKLTSLDVADESLLVNTVDHTSDIGDTTGLDVIDSRIDIDNSPAPYLYLTPRVANLLRDVFRSVEKTALSTDRDPVQSSPLADHVEADIEKEPGHGDKVVPVVGLEEDEVVPSFQQQMYRKDI